MNLMGTHKMATFTRIDSGDPLLVPIKLLKPEKKTGMPQVALCTGIRPA